jgi:hypothetical protein
LALIGARPLLADLRRSPNGEARLEAVSGERQFLGRLNIASEGRSSHARGDLRRRRLLLH